MPLLAEYINIPVPPEAVMVIEPSLAPLHLGLTKAADETTIGGGSARTTDPVVIHPLESFTSHW